ncbi:MAG: hypothetical protein E6Q24_21195 [Chitinophagaceae bacterium]|nr:MAG: hypothetical protein E6Q24_21195 [Chitinophagaceae bacterium]
MALQMLFQPHPQYLTNEELSFPFKVINNFFSDHYLDEAKELIDIWIASANRKEQWSKYSPSFLLSFFEQTNALVEASWVIEQMDNRGRLADLSQSGLGRSELSQSDYYCSDHFRKDPWKDFPRTLKWKQYLNPYSVFPKFFRFQALAKWKQDLHSLLHTALSDSKIDGGDFNLLSVSKHLNKMFEACHLIHVREFEWIKKEIAFKERKR